MTMFLDQIPTRLGQAGSVTTIFTTIVLLVAARVVYSCYFHPYADVPGPFWAKLTRLWLARQVMRGDLDKTQRELHYKHGLIVRIAPNEVSIADPNALKTIYAVNSGFTKTDFYTPFEAHISPNEDNFTKRDEKFHAYRRRFVNNIYSMTSILESERYIDSCTRTFMTRLDEFAVSGTIVDLSMWFQMYAFDVIGELFFGKEFGFMRDRHDYGKYIQSLDTLLPIITMICVLPSYLRPLQVIAILTPGFRKALTSFNKLVGFSKTTVRERQSLMDRGDVGRSDLLDKLFQIEKEKDDFTVEDVTSEAYTGIFAGSDTTAIAMRSITYYLLKNYKTYTRLTHEIDDAFKEGRLSDPVQYNEAIRLPYFMACCKEGFRIHPSVGMSMPRHVPSTGAKIAGRYFPSGSRVGISAHVLHFDQDVFGKDANCWNPERWLQPGAEVMERHMLHFGAGSRTCIGKNISLAEIYKLLPNILRKYKLELAQPEKNWSTHNFWFIKQTDMDVRVTRR